MINFHQNKKIQNLRDHRTIEFFKYKKKLNKLDPEASMYEVK